MNRLQKKYQDKVIPIFQKEMGIKNPLAVPRVEKVVFNVGIGDISLDKGALVKAKDALKAITGQKALVCPAKKAIADYKTRKGVPVGLKVTLRKKRMYQFMDKLFSVVLPRVRDFQGVKRSAFDKQANYTLGLKEQIIFPEVDYDKIDRVRGMEISFLISTKDKKKALRLLELLGMPFEKEIERKSK
ncbi:50S ribosomal protein L5 [Candidatus Beckwithbacteria bacterium CG10_big_fil_rev_8_21_14_0_10_34_10]|uniref:Large ribosomal subunit protein uL5 n=1 Tax=Candidatus Beckwithbacteria bacterium CG10_big_fil_rev_8_21_14_0_10_34_10 TaxID=1974495 RepID=A0A2H0W7V0_9BACT|nr:MAG: 50S ribosomal protein L5 [Candidatus Beckwithbacteria bacterium CG10_big_fil_rev_8_21_14_0_10_34_10]